MKKVISAFVLFTLFISCNSGNSSQHAAFNPDADYVQIVMFHLQARCESCNAVEEVTLSLLQEDFKEELDEGSIRFIPMVIQAKNSKSAAEHLGATGQNLFVVKGDVIEDLTGEAFLFAHTHPDRYREALKGELDKLME